MARDLGETLMVTWGCRAPLSAAPQPPYKARHPKVVAMLGLDAFQVDFGVVAAAAVLQ
jgi:hypothetical protein